jgi:hypothetical protein
LPEGSLDPWPTLRARTRRLGEEKRGGYERLQSARAEVDALTGCLKSGQLVTTVCYDPCRWGRWVDHGFVWPRGRRMMPRRVRHVIDAILAQRDELPQATDSEG